MRTITVVGLLLLLHMSTAFGRNPGPTQTNDPAIASDADAKRLGVDYTQTCRMKIASRKDTYRVGEVATVDVAVQNISGKPLFLHDIHPDYIRLDVKNAGGVDLQFAPYVNPLLYVSPDDFSLIEDGEFVVGSFDILIGCDVEGRDAFLKRNEIALRNKFEHPSDYSRNVFDGNLFVTWGDGCLSVAQPGEVTVTCEQANETVIVSKSDRGARTAVGKIRSEPLKLKIVS